MAALDDRAFSSGELGEVGQVGIDAEPVVDDDRLPRKVLVGGKRNAPAIGSDDGRARCGLKIGSGVLTSGLAVEDGAPAEAARGGPGHGHDERLAPEPLAPLAREDGFGSLAFGFDARQLIRWRIDKLRRDGDAPGGERAGSDRDPVRLLERASVRRSGTNGERVTPGRSRDVDWREALPPPGFHLVEEHRLTQPLRLHFLQRATGGSRPDVDDYDFAWCHRARAMRDLKRRVLGRRDLVSA